ncbi:MAG: diaminopimelate decarboxylase [Clostridia bacterium]|nr:diaminopimelate decarboxylase [Clostridia bacterium]
MNIMKTLETKNGELLLGGASVSKLAKEYGTPLYLMDEEEIRANCLRYENAIRKYYRGEALVLYASKAFSCKAIYRTVRECGLGCDVVSGGELYTALAAGMEPERIFFHGNNKTETEIREALSAGVGRIVLDSAEELRTVDRVAAELGVRAAVSVRIKPGIDAHTHDFIATGKIDSKFGVALETGEAKAFIGEILQAKHTDLCGLHCHIGSQIFDTRPFVRAAEVMMAFMAELRESYGCTIGELNVGGGVGIRYLASHDPLTIEENVKNTALAVMEAAERFNYPLPRLCMEPGRSIVGDAGLTVYTVGSVKEIPGVRNYVSVDGGMTDNPRFALYEAAYEAVLPERPEAARDTVYTVAGRCCESGDILIRDIKLPKIRPGELLCVLSTGAYNYSMASNYNRVPRPPVVFIRNGAHRPVVRRETYADVMAKDLD